jgi:hypothetical protein
MGIGRGRAICENDEIMQIPPVRATMRCYKSIAGAWQYVHACEARGQN